MPAVIQNSVSFVLFAFFSCATHGIAWSSQRIPTAVIDIAYVDSSGEMTGQSPGHDARSRAFFEDLRRDLAASEEHRIVTLVCDAAPCTSGSNAQDLRAAAPKAAESFTARDILAAVPDAHLDASKPVKIVVFDFELIDFSGGASIIPESADDTENLKLATEAARRLIAQSERYSLVNVSSADTEWVRSNKLHDCDGCDAAIALRLGAEQSLVGIVTRITRTDYAVTFKLRDAQSSKLINVEQTDLRIGANYSWDRGAAWLIKNKLLDKDRAP